MTASGSRHTCRFALAAVCLLLSAALTGCAARSTRTLGAAVAVRGQSVAEAALAGYQALAAEQDADRRQQDFIKVVTNPDPAAAGLPASEPASFGRELDVRVQAYTALRSAYATFQRLADPAFSDQSGEATRALASSVAAFVGVKDGGGAVGTVAARLSRLATAAVQAGKIKQHNAVLAELSSAYRTLWEADLPAWRAYIAQVHDTYARQLASLSIERFDAKALATEFKSPYVAGVRAQLYKLELRHAARQRGAALEAQLEAVSRALGALERAHVELAKNEPSIAEVNLLLDDIRHLLEPLQ